MPVPSVGKIRVLVVDDHTIVRSGLKIALEEELDMLVVGEARDGEEAIEKFESCDPEVVIMDLAMPQTDGLEAIRRILSAHHQARILVLSMHPEEHFAVRVFKAGCLGYITKAASNRELRDAVRAVAHGRKYLTDVGKEVVALQLLGGRETSSSVSDLSDRELQVLILVARGQKLKEIAKELNLSTRTIETYRLRAFRKLNLRNDADVARFALQNRLLY